MARVMIDPHRALRQPVLERYRCPDDTLPHLGVAGPLSDEAGYFRFGQDVICYGRCSGSPAAHVSGAQDVLPRSEQHADAVLLPFDLSEAVTNLTEERYAAKVHALSAVMKDLYYGIRPLLPVLIRRHIQAAYFRNWNEIPFPLWPVDTTVEHGDLGKHCIFR